MGDQILWLDLLDRLVANSASHLPARSLALARHAAERMRRRRHFAGFTTLVGLAGGTGSGKSSLFNAISDSDLAEPGSQRPTTARPLVLVPAEFESRLTNLWEELGIHEVEVAEPGSPRLGFVLIDLPDVDSLNPSHRRQVDRLLLDLDVVVWVTDPEKYRDRALHDQFLRPLVAHAGRFLFALNQIDRLEASEIEDVRSDLVWALRQDGFEDPSVWLVAADPTVGPPLGIEELTEAIRAAASDQGEGENRVRAEIGRLLRAIDHDLAPLNFNKRWDEIRARVGSTWPASQESLLEFVAALRVEAPELASIDPMATIGRVPPQPPEAIERHLDQTLGRALRDALRARARSKAIAAELQWAVDESR